MFDVSDFLAQLTQWSYGCIAHTQYGIDAILKVWHNGTTI